MDDESWEMIGRVAGEAVRVQALISSKPSFVDPMAVHWVREALLAIRGANFYRMRITAEELRLIW